MSTLGTEAGTKLEAFFTPYPLAWAITQRVFAVLDRAGLPSHSIIEPSVGGGAFAESIVLSGRKHHLTVNDIDPDWPRRFWEVYPDAVPVISDWGSDDPIWGQCSDVDLIIGNPPFTQAELHVRKGLARGKVVAFLLRVGFVAGKDRCKEFYTNYPVYYFAPIYPRPSFTGGGNDSSEYALVLWRRDHKGDGVFGQPLRWEP